MKNLSCLILLIALSGQVFGQQSQNRNLASFSGVKVAEGIDVYLKKGDKESARVEATGTDADNVITEVSGSYLKVHMKDTRFRGNVDVKVYVTYVSIEKLSASSAGNIFSDGPIRSREMDISCSSAGNVEISLEAEEATISASSAGEIELQGRVKALSAEASSAGEIDAYDLEAEDVHAAASSAGSVKVSVSNNLVANASSGGSIRFRGSPAKSITNSSSGGSVKKTN